MSRSRWTFLEAQCCQVSCPCPRYLLMDCSCSVLQRRNFTSLSLLLPGFAALYGCSSAQRLWSFFIPTPPNKIQSSLFFWVCPEQKLLNFRSQFGCLDNPSCQLVYHRGSVHCSPHCLTLALTKTLGVLNESCSKSSTAATSFAQPFSAESPDCCFKDFPPCHFQESINQSFGNQSKSKGPRVLWWDGHSVSYKILVYWNFVTESSSV